MKVPNAYVPRTEPSSQPLSYLQPATNNAGEMIGRAASNLGDSLVHYSVVAKNFENEGERFKAITQQNEMETAWAVRKQELEKTAPADGAGWYKTIADESEKFKTDFLKGLPASQQADFGARISQWQQTTKQGALAYQYQLGDTNYRSGIATQYQKALEGIEADPATFDAHKQRLNEMIDATPTINGPEKELLRRQLMTGLETKQFTQEETKKRYAAGESYAQFQTDVGKSLNDIRRGGTPSIDIPTQYPLFSKTQATTQVPGMVAPGTIDLTKRPTVHNADGSISTVYTTSYSPESGPNKGKEILIPRVPDEGGKIMSEHEAIKYWGEKGQNLGVFDSVANADAYAKVLHEQLYSTANKPVGGDLTKGYTLTPEQAGFLPAKEVTPRGFYAASAKEFDRQADHWMQTVQPELRDQYKAKLAETKAEVLQQALEYSNKTGDAVDLSNVKTQTDVSRTTLEHHPDQLEAEKKRIDTLIDSTGMAAVDKNEWKKTQHGLLEAVAAKDNPVGLGVGPEKGNAQQFAMSHLQSIDGGNGQPISKTAAAALIGNFVAESGGSLNPNASRPHDGNCSGPESESIGIGQWNCARHTALKNFAAAKGQPWNSLGLQLEFAAKEFQQNYPEAWAKLQQTTNQDEATAIVTTQYTKPAGSQSGAVASSQWARRRDTARKLAGGVYGGGNVGEPDPRFSNVPYETRLSITRDAEAEANRVAAESLRQRQQAAADLQNQQMMDIYHNKRNQSDVETDYSNGTLTNAEHYHAQTEAITTRDKEGADYRQGNAALSNEDYRWNPMSEDDKKKLNAVAKGSAMNESIASRNAEAVTNNLIPQVQRTHMIPSTTIGVLEEMSRSTSPANFKFAYETFAQLQATDPAAYASQVNGDLASNVAFFQARKNLGMKPEEMMHALGIGTDPALHAAEENRRKQAEQILRADVPGTKIPTSDQKFEDAIAGFKNSSSFYNHISSQAPQYAPAAQALHTEWETIFKDEFAKYGTVDEATTATNARIKTLWGVDESGGRPTVMRNPPILSGYTSLSHSDGLGYIKRDVHSSLNLARDDNFELISDDQTKNELEKYKAGQGPLPSYAVIIYDKNGISRLPDSNLGTGTARVRPTPSPQDLAEDAKGTMRSEISQDHFKFMNEADNVRAQAEALHQPYPQEYSDAEVKLRQQQFENQMKVLEPQKLNNGLVDRPEQTPSAPQPGPLTDVIPSVTFDLPGAVDKAKEVVKRMLDRPAPPQRARTSDLAAPPQQPSHPVAPAFPDIPPTQVPTAVPSPPMEQGAKPTGNPPKPASKKPPHVVSPIPKID